MSINEHLKSYSCLFGSQASSFNPRHYRTKVIILDTLFYVNKHRTTLYLWQPFAKLINSVAEKVNNDKMVKDKLKIVFIPNYGSSLEELVIPASDIYGHTPSTGMDTSDTSNMMFALNGGLIIGTHDGTNIDIAEHFRMENMFLFKLTTGITFHISSNV